MGIDPTTTDQRGRGTPGLPGGAVNNSTKSKSLLNDDDDDDNNDDSSLMLTASRMVDGTGALKNSLTWTVKGSPWSFLELPAPRDKRELVVIVGDGVKTCVLIATKQRTQVEATIHNMSDLIVEVGRWTAILVIVVVP